MPTIRHFIALPLLAAYILSGMVVGMDHHGGTALILQHAPLITSHTCGENERHVPLEKLHPCPMCSLSSDRAFPTHGTQAAQPAGTESLLGPARSQPYQKPVHHFSSGKRGPPFG